MSNRVLARRVGLTEATVAARVRRLAERGVLDITTVFDREAAGYALDVWLAVEIDESPVRRSRRGRTRPTRGGLGPRRIRAA